MTSFNSAALRELLLAALSDEELTILAYDCFRPGTPAIGEAAVVRL